MSETENDHLIRASKILIVEDEYHARKTMRALLRAMGAPASMRRLTATAVSRRPATFSGCRAPRLEDTRY